LFAPKDGVCDETVDARELEEDDPFANVACDDAMVDGIDLEDNGVEVGALMDSVLEDGVADVPLQEEEELAEDPRDGPQ
jgi:hypothetical protein